MKREIDSQYIHKALELLDEDETKRYKYLIRNIEAVDKSDLQFFVLQLWDAFQQRKEKLCELDEKYNSLCDRLEYEEGWDPRTQSYYYH